MLRKVKAKQIRRFLDVFKTVRGSRVLRSTP
jgi:hypothetical protein